MKFNYSATVIISMLTANPEQWIKWKNNYGWSFVFWRSL